MNEFEHPGKPSLESLLRHLERHGPEAILESATHLSEEEFAELEEAVKAATPRPPKKRRKR